MKVLVPLFVLVERSITGPPRRSDEVFFPLVTSKYAYMTMQNYGEHYGEQRGSKEAVCR